MKRITSMAVCFSLVVAMVSFTFSFFGVKASAAEYSGTVYYIDSVYGDDSNDGKSEKTAWKTLNKANKKSRYKPGDAVLLRRGCVFNGGWLWIKGSGEEGKPITISSYGDENLPKPAIISDITTNFTSETPSYNAAVFLDNQSWVTIDGIDITNGTKSQTDMYGVFNYTHGGYYTEGVTIKNCVISGSSKFKWSQKYQSAMTGIACLDPNYWGYISGFNVENNELYNIKGVGISVNGSYSGCNANGSLNSKNSAQNVHISGNYLQNIGKDGILVTNSIKPVVEYNTCNKAHSYATNSYHVAMWPFASYGALFQFNEAYNTQTTLDGQGYDCDYQSYYTTFQYNYSHDNQGGFMLICTEPQNWDGGVAYNIGSVVRYNISQNDMSTIINLTCHIKDTKVYNNTIYVGKDKAKNGINVYSRDNVKYPVNTMFANNIFYVESGVCNWYSSTGTVWKNNIVYGEAAANYPQNDNEGGSGDAIEASGNINADPKLAAPGKAGIGWDNVDAYKLLSGSPALNAGIAVSDNGGRDYFGNAVGTGACNIGAYNGAAVDKNSVTTHKNAADKERVDPTGVDNLPSIGQNTTAKPTSTTATTKPSTSTNPSVGKALIDWDVNSNFYAAGVVSKNADGITISTTSGDRQINSWNNNTVGGKGISFSVNSKNSGTSLIVEIDKKKTSTISLKQGANDVSILFASIGASASDKTEINMYFSPQPVSVTIGDVKLIESTTPTTKPTVKPTNPSTGVVYGDVNNDGAVNMKDILQLRKYIAGYSVTINETNTDVNLDGAINMKDVLVIRKYIAGYKIAPWY